jgi:hypothetical protein
MYPNAHPNPQQFKLNTPRQSIDGHLNGMPPNAAQMPVMRPMPDPKMHLNRPENLKEARSGSLNQERVPVQGPIISQAELDRYRILRGKLIQNLFIPIPV